MAYNLPYVIYHITYHIEHETYHIKHGIKHETLSPSFQHALNFKKGNENHAPCGRYIR